MAKRTLKRSSWRQHGIMIDFINAIIFLLILAAGIFLLINHTKYMIMFPVIFLLASIMNGTLGVKKYKMDEYASCIISFIVSLILMGFSIFSLIVVL